MHRFDFAENFSKLGGVVHPVASESADDDAIVSIFNIKKARCVALAKSKSLTTEEIELNQPLIDSGINVVETDLGELIIQLVHEKPFHLVFPSVHKMAPDVARIFSRVTGEEVASDNPSLMKVVHKYLRPVLRLRILLYKK